MKSWYASKTLWLNLFAAIALFAQSQFGYVLSPDVQAYALIVVNMILRVVTHEQLSA